MTIDQFIDIVGRLRHKGTGKLVKWQLRPGLQGRHRIRTIAKRVFEGKKGEAYCPIMAILKAKKGKSLPNVAYGYAGEELNIKEKDIWTIVDTADKNPWNYDKKLRARLLKACRLKEKN